MGECFASRRQAGRRQPTYSQLVDQLLRGLESLPDVNRSRCAPERVPDNLNLACRVDGESCCLLALRT